MSRCRAELSKGMEDLFRMSCTFEDREILNLVTAAVIKDEKKLSETDFFIVSYPQFELFYDDDSCNLACNVSWFFSRSLNDFPLCRTTVSGYYPYIPAGENSPKMSCNLDFLKGASTAVVFLPNFLGGINCNCPRYLVCLSDEAAKIETDFKQKIKAAFAAKISLDL
ncbi:MAG: hypothetical protein NTW50_04140 [Candidatus Berkelbacteria bacterium]|nr:hypothetical protein [Candidatus Berkelbacteria bacterium]